MSGKLPQGHLDPGSRQGRLDGIAPTPAATGFCDSMEADAPSGSLSQT